jgi:hypothetical protein
VRFLRRFFIRLSNFATTRRVDQRLREEMAEYVTLQTVENLLAGTFDPHDASPGSNGEVVISDGLWKRAFGADPRIVGKSCHPNDLLWDADEFTL